MASTFVSEAELRRAWAACVESEQRLNEVVAPKTGTPGTIEELIRRAQAYIAQYPSYQPALTRLDQLETEWQRRWDVYQAAMERLYALGYSYDAAVGHICPAIAAIKRGEPYSGTCADEQSHGCTCLRRQIMEGR